MKALRLGSRKSALARIQAKLVAQKLKQLMPALSIEFVFKESLGDKNLQDPLWKMPERGVFTEDFTQDLEQGKVDAVVHSCKDLPVEDRKNTEIVATLERADPRDILFFKRKHLGKDKLNFYSSSPRRIYNAAKFLTQALPFKTQVQFENVRGNVPTRLKKYLTDQFIDGIILAKAGLDRLMSFKNECTPEEQDILQKTLDESLFMLLPLSQNPGAAAQGAVAIEILCGRKDLQFLFSKINEQTTFDCMTRERDILKSYGGGCHQKIGVAAIPHSLGTILSVRGESTEGKIIETWVIETKQSALPHCVQEKLFPLNPEEQNYFDREYLKVAQPDPKFALWLSKAEALPKDWSIHPTQIVWASGVESWKKIAARNIWVSGCADSLGEDQENIKLESLMSDLQWIKLSHDRAPLPPYGTLLATYKLIPKAQKPNFQGKTHFFWASSSAFLRALELEPSIKLAYHACGPGHTYQCLRKHLDQEIFVFLNHRSWKAHCLGMEL